MTVTDTDLCPGTNRFPKTVKRGPGHRGRVGTCCICGMAVELMTHPDAGPGPVAGEHPQLVLGEEKASG
jgi:hypothetical protein